MSCSLKYKAMRCGHGNPRPICHTYVPTMTFICLFCPVCNRIPRKCLCSASKHKYLPLKICPSIGNVPSIRQWLNGIEVLLDGIGQTRRSHSNNNKKSKHFSWLCRSTQSSRMECLSIVYIGQVCARGLKFSCIFGSYYIRSPYQPRINRVRVAVISLLSNNEPISLQLTMDTSLFRNVLILDGVYRSCSYY